MRKATERPFSLPPGAGEREGSPVASLQRRLRPKVAPREAAAGRGEGDTVATRRNFLRSVGLAAAGSAIAGAARAATPLQTVPSRPIVKPPALKPGDTVGLVAPASFVWDLWKLDEVAARLEGQLGLKSKLGKNVKARHGYMAGTEKERLEDLHAMFADKSVQRGLLPRGRLRNRTAPARPRHRAHPPQPEDLPRLLGHHGTPPRHHEEGRSRHVSRPGGRLEAAGLDARLAPEGALRADSRSASSRILRRTTRSHRPFPCTRSLPAARAERPRAAT